MGALPQHSTMIPAASASAYAAARHRAAFVDRTAARGRVVVSGADRASFLHALFTNDITSLGPGRGCYTAYLTAQGRMIADAHVYELGDVILMTLPRDVTDAVVARLDQSIFSEDVQLGNVTETFDAIAVAGPEAATVVQAALQSISADALRALPEHGNVRTGFDGSPAIATRIADDGLDGYEVYVERGRGSALLAALERLNVPALDAEAADALRIEAGAPAFHRDMDEETIPLEAGIESRAISFTKGCYVGQEVIVRVLHRGHGRVVRKLVGLRVNGSQVPAPGSPITAADREIGRVTSAAFSPALEAPIALGYVHRDFVEPGTTVAIDGTTAIVTTLPFV